VVEPTGSETLVFCDFGDVSIWAEFAERPRLDPGQELRLSVQVDRVHVFSAETKERL
jgi:hypothetical protein